MKSKEPAHAASPPGSEPNLPRVIASFSDYEPQFDPVPMVRRMLDSVPKNYLAGLSVVRLSNASGLPGKRRKIQVKSRKRKFGLDTARGLYHPAFRGNQAWIEIFVDNAMRGWDSGWARRVPYIREMRISDVLFHEIGHHIHYAVRPEHREKEDVADVWKVRLENNYNRQRFRWVGLIARIIRPVFGAFLGRLYEKLGLQMLGRGQISRAEYLEMYRKETKAKT